MIYTKRLYILCFLSLFILVSSLIPAFAVKRSSTEDDMRIKECVELCHMRKYPEAKQKASDLINIGSKSGNLKTEAIGTALYVMSAVTIGNEDNYDEKIALLNRVAPRKGSRHWRVPPPRLSSVAHRPFSTA